MTDDSAKLIDCRSIDSGTAGCCRAINDLLEEIDNGGSGLAGAEKVAAFCVGIG